MRNSWKNKKLLKKKKGFIIYYLVPKRVRDQASGVIYLNAFRIRLISKWPNKQARYGSTCIYYMSGSDCGKLEWACLLQSRQPPAVLPYGKSDHMCQISQLLEQYPELKVFCENSPFFRMLAEFFFFLNITRQTKQVRPRVDCQSTTCSNIHIGKLYLLIFRSLESTYRWIKA